MPKYVNRYDITDRGDGAVELGHTIRMLDLEVAWFVDMVEMDSRDPHPFVIQYRQLTDMNGTILIDAFVYRNG